MAGNLWLLNKMDGSQKIEGTMVGKKTKRKLQ
jgi:hypothetical protein